MQFFFEEWTTFSSFLNLFFVICVLLAIGLCLNVYNFNIKFSIADLSSNSTDQSQDEILIRPKYSLIPKQ